MGQQRLPSLAADSAGGGWPWSAARGVPLWRLMGTAHFLGGTDYGNWLSELIELRDGIPFLITRGYTPAGLAESADSYLSYCMANCDWSTDRSANHLTAK